VSEFQKSKLRRRRASRSNRDRLSCAKTPDIVKSRHALDSLQQRVKRRAISLLVFEVVVQAAVTAVLGALFLWFAFVLLRQVRWHDG
jgi:hypothetical protein